MVALEKPCRPPPGYTFLTIGQDLFSINEYALSQYNYSLHKGSLAPMTDFTPAAAMVYTSLASMENGTSLPVDYGSGIEYADGIVNSIFPDQGVGLQIGLWLDGALGCDKINNGTMDDKIRALVEYLETSNASKIFLRIGYEFDNPSFGFSYVPLSYVNAFRRIVSMCRCSLTPAGKSKVKFVWHSWAAPRASHVDLIDFYPGDQYVDWVGVSIFQQLYPWSSGDAGTIGNVVEVLEFAKTRDKPTMIAESTPFGGIDMNSPETEKYSETDPWERWFAKVIDLIEKYDISMWSYINCDWDSQPMWRGVGFGETRISFDEKVLSKWHDIMFAKQSEDSSSGSSSRFLMAGSLEHCQDYDMAMISPFSRNTSSDGETNELPKFFGNSFIVGVCFVFLVAVVEIIGRIRSKMKKPPTNQPQEVVCHTRMGGTYQEISPLL